MNQWNKIISSVRDTQASLLSIGNQVRAPLEPLDTIVM